MAHPRSTLNNYYSHVYEISKFTSISLKNEMLNWNLDVFFNVMQNLSKKYLIY